MKRKWTSLATISLLLAAVGLYALTNVSVTVPVYDAQYTNLVGIASNQNMSVEMLLSNRLVAEIKGMRVSLLLDLWENATPIQQENALNALRQ